MIYWMRMMLPFRVTSNISSCFKGAIFCSRDILSGFFFMFCAILLSRSAWKRFKTMWNDQHLEMVKNTNGTKQITVIRGDLVTCYIMKDLWKKYLPGLFSSWGFSKSKQRKMCWRSSEGQSKDTSLVCWKSQVHFQVSSYSFENIFVYSYKSHWEIIRYSGSPVFQHTVWITILVQHHCNVDSWLPSTPQSRSQLLLIYQHA